MVSQWLPSILGALLVVVGVAVVWWPAGLVVAGVFLLVVDHRMPTPSLPKAPRPRDEVR